jgi:hypothetical protein
MRYRGSFQVYLISVQLPCVFGRGQQGGARDGGIPTPRYTLDSHSLHMRINQKELTPVQTMYCSSPDRLSPGGDPEERSIVEHLLYIEDSCSLIQ